MMNLFVSHTATLRARYTKPDGSFDAAAFDADVSKVSRSVIRETGHTHKHTTHQKISIDTPVSLNLYIKKDIQIYPFS